MKLGAYLVVLAACGGGAGEVVKEPAAPAPPAGGNPCFAGEPPLAAGDIYQRFEKHAESWYLGDEGSAPPAETFGTCTMHQGKLRDAAGTVLARLGCGVQIYAPGIRDDLGLEIGARGADVLARWSEPHGPMACIGNGPDQTRCRFDRAEGSDTDFTTYVVAGGLPADRDALAGPEAEAFFAEREIVQIWHSVWCH